MDGCYNPEDPRAYVQFNALLTDFYQKNKRPMPWRDEICPYWVVVSELMLQQTQVSRVMQKFPEFINLFPDFATLAHASLEEVFRAWQGLGYNRRAKYLRQIAQEVLDRWDGIVPDDPAVLQTLPGIGKATAGSIVAFTYDIPVVFIETNTRRVFIHHFFQDRSEVSDKEILPIVARALDLDHPREWFYSLMDYGTYLAKKIDNPNRRSNRYSVQSPFRGSDREIRGQILKILLADGPTYRDILVVTIAGDAERVHRIVDQMIGEDLIVQEGSLIRFR